MAEILTRATCAAALVDYLGELARRPFDPVAGNCLFVCADWVRRVTGRDPAAAWRPLLHDAGDMRRLLRQAGGARALATAAWAAHGLAPTPAPVAGDVALVTAPYRCGRRIMRVATGALCVAPDHFALVTRDCGLVIARLPLLAAWLVIDQIGE